MIPKDVARKALEHITILNLYDKLRSYEINKETPQRLREIGEKIVQEYIEENKS